MESTAAEDGQLSQPLLPTTNSTTEEGRASSLEKTDTGQAQENVAEDREETSIRHEEEESPWYHSPLQLVAMLSNYSTSYNVVNISMVIPILKHTMKGTTPEDVAASASSLLAGMIVGQLGGGYLGDTHLGRLGALQLVMALQVVASIGGALLSSHMRRESFFVCLAIFRFLLGVGAGGVYPLAAVLSAENGKHQQRRYESPASEEDKVRRVVLTFSMQGLGFITVPLLSSMLLCMTSNLDAIWRLILAYGSVPGLVLMGARLWIYQMQSRQSTVFGEDEVVEEMPPIEADMQHSEQATDEEDAGEPQMEEGGGTLLRNMAILEEQVRPERHHGWWESIRRENNLVHKLLGTAGTWFLFDVLFYGNSLFQAVVIDAAFGGSRKGSDAISEISDTALKSLFVYSIALPGYAVAGALMGKRVGCALQTPKCVMLQGFAAMGTLYLALGTYWDALKRTPLILVLLYGLTFFFANYGPNTTTFILPSMVFSEECRTTLNGVSAAAGKLGALTGATLFGPLVEYTGDAHVMIICSAIALAAFLMTLKCVNAANLL